MKIVKIVTDKDNDHSHRIKDAVEMVNAVQNYILFQYDEEIIELNQEGLEVHAGKAKIFSHRNILMGM